ncbi:polysaccharide biosynthesis/export family protein [Tritonibacter horizontis]|uniref:Polysaccharide biosynthesis/export protein n=1 Tax=Tritonibacter horizontis TaxID=1768241 RepID=A0A132BYW9_9RHOB|nr:polysaccharide biosynthesis/export family protein [Tritonibacter horizontis]KUP93581.1 polysaccharide biosynthesis/export protein [Tritonibacter horizontis]
MRCLKTFFVLAGLALLPAACDSLPGGAPVSRDIVREAEQPGADFALYPVTRAFLPSVAQWPETGAYEVLPWLPYAQGAKTQIIQPGDTLNIQVWDSNDNSLLTAPSQRMTQLQGMKVAGDGTIFMPYLGNVSVRGMTPDLARAHLQEALETIVPSAQVQLAMEEGRNNSVDLVSGVSRPGTYPMPDRNYTVMGLISAGGGIGVNLNNPQIRLVRGSRIYGTSVQNLLNNPRLDSLLRGGDRVFVEEDERYFLSFGATRTEALHTFTKDRMSAMDAISITGGLQDGAADAKGILVLREYPATAVAPGVRGPRQTRVVFSLDLTSAEGLFSARQFEINPQDLVIATEAPINDAVTVAGLIGNFVGVFNSASRINN